MDLTATHQSSTARQVGVLLIAHAPLASAYLRVACDLGLATAPVMAFDYPVEMSREQALATTRMLVADARCDACLVLVDVCGGASPSTVARMLQAAIATKTSVVTGLNLPMLMTVLCHAGHDLAELASRAVNRGRDGVQEFPKPAIPS